MSGRPSYVCATAPSVRDRRLGLADGRCAASCSLFPHYLHCHSEILRPMAVYPVALHTHSPPAALAVLQLAASPPDGPLRLGCMLEVYHDGAWWGCELVGVAGPAEDLRRLAAGPGAAGRTGEGGSSGSGSGSGALLAVQLLDAPDRVEVPPERTRFRLSWDERTATWSSSRGRGVSGDVLPGERRYAL